MHQPANTNFPDPRRHYIRLQPTPTSGRRKQTSYCAFCHSRSLLHLSPLSQFPECTRGFDVRAEKGRLLSRVWRDAVWNPRHWTGFSSAPHLQFRLQLFSLLCHVGTISNGVEKSFRIQKWSGGTGGRGEWRPIEEGST